MHCGTALLPTWQPHAHGLGMRPAPALPPAAPQAAWKPGGCLHKRVFVYTAAVQWQVKIGWKFQPQADTWTAARTHLQPCTAAADLHLRCGPSSQRRLAIGHAQSYLHKSGRRLYLSDGAKEHVALCVTCSWHVISCSESGLAKQCQTAAAPKAATHQQCSVHRAPTCASCWQNRTSCGMAASAGTAPPAHLRLGHQKQ